MTAFKTPRPVSLTPEMSIRAAEKTVDAMIADEILQGHHRTDDITSIANVAGRHDDGYAIAKKLEQRCGWDCDLETAQALDAFSTHARREIESAEAQWLKENGIAPTLAAGTRVRTPRGETGTIAGLYPYGSAKYAVKIDGDPQAEAPHFARRIVNFEDAEPLVPEGEG